MTEYTTINPRKFFLCQISLICIISIVSYVLVLVGLSTEFKSSRFQTFYVGGEANIPTWYASTALLFSAFLLFIIWRTKRSSGKLDAKYWFALTLVLVYMSIDEFISIHERANHYLKNMADIRIANLSILRAWIFPFTILTIVTFIFFIKFLTRLPKRTSIIFFIAGSIFVLGALGTELIEWYLIEYVYEIESRKVQLTIAFEEFLEMMSVAVFTYGILDYINKQILPITFSSEKSDSKP